MTPFIKFAYALSGPDRGRRIGGEAEILAILRDRDLGWLALQADDPSSRPWIEANLGFMDPHAVAALAAAETRPRGTAFDSGVLLILRAVNAAEGEAPEDMVSIRMWIDPARIVSLTRRQAAELDELAAEIERGAGPSTAGEFIAALVERLNRGIETLRQDLDEECDDIEEILLGRPDPELRPRLTEIRQKVIYFRRYLLPQRDAIESLLTARPAMLSGSDTRRLAEAHDRLTRTIEDLDAMRDRLAVAKDELTTALSERLNRNLYLLAVISVVFLPLSFLTGLLGINVAGIPGSESPGAFWIFTALVVAILVVQLIWLRWRRWF